MTSLLQSRQLQIGMDVIGIQLFSVYLLELDKKIDTALMPVC